MFRIFKMVEWAVSRVVEIIGMILLMLMTLVVCYTVFTRYFLNFSPAWGEEMALLCMVWFGFMAIALGVRDDGHIGVTIMDRFYPPLMLRLLNLFKYVCVGVFAVFMIREGFKMAQIGRWNKLPGMGITSWWLYIIVPVCGVAILVYCIEKLYEHIRGDNGTRLDEEDGR